MEEKETLNVDQSIIEGYAQVMKDYSPIGGTNWEMQGEYYKQFSIYSEKYITRVTNKAEDICQAGVTF